MFLLILNQFKRKVIITSDLFIRINLIETIRIPLSQIQGYRIVEKGQKVYYGDKFVQDIFIYGGYNSELSMWLRENLINLDEQARVEEYAHILNHVNKPVKDNTISSEPRSENLKGGIATEPDLIIDNNNAINDTISEEELDNKLEWYFKIMIAYDTIAFIGFLFNIVSPNLILMCCMVLYPIIGLFIIAKSNSLIRLVYKETSPRHSLFIGMVICCSVLILTRINYEQPFVFTYFWILGLIISACFISVAYFIDHAEKSEPFDGRRLWLLVIGLLYGYGSLTQIEYVIGYFMK